LSQSYKRIYIREGNKTDTPKRAAITCAAIAAVQPLRPPLVVNDLDKEEYIYANPMFAIRCASSIVGHPFDKRPYDDRRRAYRAILGFSFPSISPILQEARARNGDITSEFDINITGDEEAKINLLVEQFTIYGYLRTPEQDFR
jgi:hypothetical protein